MSLRDVLRSIGDLLDATKGAETAEVLRDRLVEWEAELREAYEGDGRRKVVHEGNQPDNPLSMIARCSRCGADNIAATSSGHEFGVSCNSCGHTWRVDAKGRVVVATPIRVTIYSPPTKAEPEANPKTAPIAIMINCPRCATPHVDTGRFATHPHRDHQCANCGLTWRPARVDTVGVERLYPSEPGEAPAKRWDARPCPPGFTCVHEVLCPGTKR